MQYVPFQAGPFLRCAPPFPSHFLFGWGHALLPPRTVVHSFFTSWRPSCLLPIFGSVNKAPMNIHVLNLGWALNSNPTG